MDDAREEEHPLARTQEARQRRLACRDGNLWSGPQSRPEVATDVDRPRGPLPTARLQAADHSHFAHRSPALAWQRVGRALPRALGDRTRVRRDQDGDPRKRGIPAQQVAGRRRPRTVEHGAALQPRPSGDGAHRRAREGAAEPDQLRDRSALHQGLLVLGKPLIARHHSKTSTQDARRHLALRAPSAQVASALSPRGENQDEQVPAEANGCHSFRKLRCRCRRRRLQHSRGSITWIRPPR